MILPDVLKPKLDAIFCGTAVGKRSAVLKAYYAGRGNRFWVTLHKIGLTPRELQPQEFRKLLEFRLGLTDLAKSKAGVDSTLQQDDFDVQALRKSIAKFRPRVVAFTSKRAAREYFGRDVPYGFASEQEGATKFFVLPSPSGAGRKYWSEEPWRVLAKNLRGAADSDA